MRDLKDEDPMPPPWLADLLAAVTRAREGQVEAGFHPWVDVPDGLADLDAVSEFDRETCGRGLKLYLRRLTPAEVAAVPPHVRRPGDSVNAVLVREIAPGVRVRQFVTGAQIAGRSPGLTRRPSARPRNRAERRVAAKRRRPR